MSTRPENSFANTTFQALVNSDPQIAHLKDGAYSKAASPERFNITKAGLEAKGFKVTIAENKDEAYEKLKSLIPAGASINLAHSTTLEEIGFINYLMGETPYVNIRAKILAEKDPVKQAELRRIDGTTVDYFLTSMCAVTENGELAHGDQTGTKVGGVAFGAKNVIVVVGSNKIVKDEAEAFKRTTEWCLPFASAFSREVFKAPGASLNNYQVIRQANPFNPDRIQVLLINEALGA
ncbi:hypothetical protein BCR41DRAFT_424182 [Lobosporangium transversale]|uniref:LUD domain-containing protein n=1 Tax=Lobosporangium transversale TaxID=64571 RepID=A0A1Y2GHQ0_9FUNG|nr:hypothetical protein BCR41DRAFT_424182 [Lobosporangium transversale]ORZ09396.1 hypothetical protein BCR41DRAFT_424182 [Lobosporangium transversale]|eukprot:XP_021878849.1 hypothetical protein BCR41DRAFT_424182 [Lobosporangium transversale]